MSIKTSPIPVRELVRRFGVNRAMVRHVIYTRFAVSTDYIRCLTGYKILPCSGSYFKEHLKDGMFYGYTPLTQEHVNFHIVYKDCTPAVVKKSAHIVLSFRIAHEDFNIEPVVMVQLPPYLSTTGIYRKERIK
jgi:hypothetical protein